MSIAKQFVIAMMSLSMFGWSGHVYAGRLERLAENYHMQQPDGDGPFPAVIMVPGCRGFNSPRLKPVYDRVQGRLRDMGFVVIRADYLAARNQDSCQYVSKKAAASDLGVTVSYVRSQPFVKQRAINVMGWSFGGGTAFVALSKGKSDTPIDVDAVIAYYPGCRSVRPWKRSPPILVLIGEDDENVSLKKCKKLFAKLPNPESVELHTYPNAYHVFDAFNLPKETKLGSRTIGYNAEAAKAAWTEVERFLRR